MEQRIYSVGQRVEKFCETCNEQLGHIVKSMTKTGKISRVYCVRCRTSGTYKPGAMIAAQNKVVPGAPYDRTFRYIPGQTLTHATFGEGEVMTVI